MAGQPNSPKREPLGAVTVEETGGPSSPPGSALPHATKLTWRPGPLLAPQLPADFKLEMECFAFPGGPRQFAPVGGVSVLVPNAWRGGLAILCHEHRLEREQLSDFQVNHFLFQQSRAFQEHFRRQFRSVKDLIIISRDKARAKRGGSQQRLLSDDIGLDRDGKGKTWSIERLLKEGDQAAREAGDLPITQAKRIQYGLLAAARRNPLKLPSKSIPDLVKRAIFEIEPTGDPIPEEVLRQVRERFCKALAKHLGDSTDKFNKWFSGKSRNLIRQLAKQRRADGGEMDQSVVRAAIVELGWRVFNQVGSCIEAQMREFAHALPTPLTIQERKAFELVYACQPRFGKVPLILIWERAAFLKPAIFEIWNSPGRREKVHVLHRLLEYYSDMMPRRRSADRTSKQQKVDRIDMDADVELIGREVIDVSDSRWSQITDHIRELSKVRCNCRSPDWQSELLSTTKTYITLGFRCGNCASDHGDGQNKAGVQEVRLTLAEFKKFGSDLGFD